MPFAAGRSTSAATIVETLLVEPGSPWENGYVESFNGKLRDECLNGELFLNRVETQYVVDRWRLDYNHHRPHSMLGWQTPAAFAARCRGRRPAVCCSGFAPAGLTLRSTRGTYGPDSHSEWTRKRGQVSPMKGMIQMMPEEAGRWVKNTMIKKWLSPHLGSGGVLSNKTVSEQANIMKEFFRAIQQSWPQAWGKPKEYSLCRPIGLEVLLGVFPSAKHRCDLNEGREYTAVTFVRQMEVLKDAVLELPGGGKLPLDWRRGPMGLISNRPARLLIVRQLKDIMTRADDNA